MYTKPRNRSIAKTNARRTWTFECFEIITILKNDVKITMPLEVFRKPNGEIVRIYDKFAKASYRYDTNLKDLSAREESVVRAFSNLKKYSTTSERGDDYLKQLNYAVIKFKEVAQNKKNNLSDLEVALKLREYEMDTFSEFSETYTHALSSWIEDVIKEVENNCGVEDLQSQPEMEV